MKENTYPCPTCKKQIRFNARHAWRPFCSERCKLIDLGQWADGSYRIAEQPDDSVEYAATQPPISLHIVK